MELVSKAIERYAEDHTDPLSGLLAELVRETKENTPEPQMLTGAVEGKFLQMLVRISGARRVVEVGTFTGFSALMMAEGLPDDGEIVTLEISGEYAGIALRYFARSPVGGRIKLLQGPAIDSLRLMDSESADFLFIDADKPSYPLYYEEGMRILRPGGLMVADNALWSGRVLAPEDEDARAITRLNEMARNDNRAEKVLLTVRDGIYLLRKKGR